MSRPRVQQRRLFDAANVLGIPTSGVKVTTSRKIRRVMHVAFQHDALGTETRIRPRHGGHQGFCIRMLRSQEDGACFGYFHQFGA